MRSLVLLLFFSAFTGFTAQAQNARATKLFATFCGSIDFQAIEDKFNVQVSNLEMPEPDAGFDQQELKIIKDKIAALYPRKENRNSFKTTSVAQPLIVNSFIADSSSGIPPDNYMAVNDSNLGVSVINSTIAVHNLTTGAYTSRKNLMAFSTAVGLNGLYDYRFDPKILYDPGADRFICVLLNSTNQHNYIVVAFSKTNNPASVWNFYKFYGNYANDTTWFDYPAISITKNEFFLTGNKILYSASWQAGFRQTLIYQFKKANGYNGDSLLTYQIWDSIRYNGKNLRCLYPLNPADTVMGPSQYFLSNRNFDTTNDSVFLVKIPDTIGSSSNILTVTPLVSSLSYGVPPDARQPDTSLSFATNDARILGGFISSNEIQFVNTSVNPSNGASAIYHGVISNYATSPSITGQIFSIDTLDFGYPNISYAGNYGGTNQSIISFNFSGPRTNPGFGAIFYDAGSFSNLQVIKTGDSVINLLSGKQQRWGDYSGSQPLWNAIGKVWVEGIFGRHNRTYGNYMAELASPYFVATKKYEAKSNSVSNLYPNPARQMVRFDFVLEKEQVVSFYIYDISGKMIEKLTEQFCKEGKNSIQFNIASLLPGNYFLKIYGNTESLFEVKTFVKQ